MIEGALCTNSKTTTSIQINNSTSSFLNPKFPKLRKENFHKSSG